MRKLKVAAVQATSKNGAPEQNLDNAGRLVERAARRGAELVCCPEFLATGYLFDETIWDVGEPLGGPTEQWLEGLATKHAITVGAGFLEADGDGFWNTFSLFGPGGKLLGRVRKGSLPFFEGWYFRPCTQPKVIDTPFGRVAVGICNDTQTAEFLRHVADERPDLILMPHSAPTPRVPLIDPIFLRIYDAQLRRNAGRYATTLGIPVVMANKVSFETDRTPLPIVPGIRIPWRFRGYSSIWEGSGVELGELVDEEDALVAEVTLDPSTKRAFTPPKRGYFAFSPGVVAPLMGPLLRGLAALGQRSYDRSAERRRSARRIRAEASSPSEASEGSALRERV